MIKKPEKSNKKGTYWYMFYQTECVLCGRGEDTKYRVYDRPKPEKLKDRYEYHQYACNSHFM